jgi:Lecithin:cholesterol acyltransferase
MSSGLEVKESNLKPNWVGKRIWINLQSLGFQSMYWGSAQKQVTASTTDDNNKTEEEKAQMNYKSAWIKHMTLDAKDMKTESVGIKVRPIEGLEGVDYLSPGALTNHVSYVFGPVIKALEDAGYNSNPSKPNLAAAPYDWRVMPLELERRDKYFSKTMTMVETLYKNNNNTPVVILGHSLGCKTSHYFMNFAKVKNGQRWIDKYIHTYMPVGGPHLGAPKALRSVISGDKMGLDAFLSDEEALVFGRSLGSGPWLIPKELPAGVPASAYILPHGALQISFTQACDANPLVNNREDLQRPRKYQLQVVGRGLQGNINERRTVLTPFQKVSSDHGPDVVSFTKDHVSFGTLPNPIPEATLHFLLQEPGIGAAKKEKDNRGCCNLGCCIASLFCCCFYLVYRLVRCFTYGVVRAGALTADAITSSAGGGTTLAFSEAVKIPPRVWKGDTVTMKVPLFHQDDYGKAEGCGCFASLVNPRKAYLYVKMKWYPYNREKSFKRICSPVCQPSDDAPDLPIEHKRGAMYQSFPGSDLIDREGLRGTTLQVRL